MAFVVFDTETSGLPIKYNNAVPTNWNNWDSSRIVQIAWEIYDSPNDVAPVASHCYIVSPEGFTIPPQSTAIHGITNEYASENGIPILSMIKLFFDDLKRYEITKAVAHNMSFDSNVLLSEMYRIGNEVDEELSVWKALKKHCTMLVGTKRGGRWPKLNALYESLLGPVDASMTLHRADVDTRLCAEIYKVQVSS